MAARGYGRGTISRRKDGLWIGRIEIQRTPRKRVTFGGKDRAEVEAKMDAWLAEHRPRQADPREPGNREQHMARARALGRHTAAEWRAKVAAAGGLCHWCRRPVSLGGVKDHIVPVSRGGSDGIDNVVLSCWDCNAAKSDLSADEFMAWAEATGFFSQPQQVTMSIGKRNRRVPRQIAAIAHIPREERAELLHTGKFAARVKAEMEKMA